MLDSTLSLPEYGGKSAEVCHNCSSSSSSSSNTTANNNNNNHPLTQPPPPPPTGSSGENESSALPTSSPSTTTARMREAATFESKFEFDDYQSSVAAFVRSRISSDPGYFAASPEERHHELNRACPLPVVTTTTTTTASIGRAAFLPRIVLPLRIHLVRSPILGCSDDLDATAVQTIVRTINETYWVPQANIRFDLWFLDRVVQPGEGISESEDKRERKLESKSEVEPDREEEPEREQHENSHSSSSSSSTSTNNNNNNNNNKSKNSNNKNVPSSIEECVCPLETAVQEDFRFFLDHKLRRGPDGKMMHKAERKTRFLDIFLSSMDYKREKSDNLNNNNANANRSSYDVWIIDTTGHQSQGMCIDRGRRTIVMGERSTKGYPTPTKRPHDCLAKTMAHELGHALGLGHPSGRFFADGTPQLPTPATATATATTEGHSGKNLMTGGSDRNGGGGSVLEDWQVTLTRESAEHFLANRRRHNRRQTNH